MSGSISGLDLHQYCMAHFPVTRYMTNPLVGGTTPSAIPLNATFTVTLPLPQVVFGLTISHCTLAKDHYGDHFDGFQYGPNNIITEEP